MKKNNGLLQKVWHHLRENPSEIIFGCYLLLIMMTSVCTTIFYTTAYKDNMFGIVLFVTLVFYSAFALTPKFHRWIGNLSFTQSHDISRKKKIQVFGLAGGITFIVLAFFYIGFYPGSFSPDSIYQYSQVVNGTYDDWNPAWHTFLIFTMPLKLTGGWIGSVVLFQMIYFSLLIGYMAVLIYVYSGRVYACLSVAFVLLNPYTIEIVMYPTKDVAFAIAAALCMLYAMNIYFTNGKWCDKLYRIFMFAFMLACATLFRHNGVLFTLILLFALFFFMQRKRWFFLFASTCVILFCIKVPLYRYNDVNKPDRRILETMGLPLSVIINVAKESPESLDRQTSDFVADLMNKQPDWKMRHDISGLNSVKWDENGNLGINNDAVKNAGVKGILQMMCHCLFVAPKESLKAVGGLTIPVYGLEVNGRELNDIPPNDYGVTYNGVKAINTMEENYRYCVYTTPLHLVFTIGFTILVMLAFILFKSNIRSFEDWKRILLCLPIFTYDFGTMLLLSGHDVRFFYVSFLVCPLVVLIMCGKRPEQTTPQKN